MVGGGVYLLGQGGEHRPRVLRPGTVPDPLAEDGATGRLAEQRGRQQNVVDLLFLVAAAEGALTRPEVEIVVGADVFEVGLLHQLLERAAGGVVVEVPDNSNGF